MKPALLIALAVLMGPIAVVHADSDLERIDQLERSISGASELGNFSRVQTLRLQLAKLFAARQQYAEAARQYELLLAGRPPLGERARLSIELGHMRSELHDYSRALVAYGDALHDEPKNWDASLAMARTYAQIELNAKALAQYERCIAIRTDRYEPYAEIAAVYQHMGYLSKALEYDRLALDRRVLPEIYLSMADCYVREGNMDAATGILQQAKTSLPQAEYDVRLGDIYRKRGDLVKAAAAWQDALKADAHRDDVRLKLAQTDDRLGRRAEADEQMRYLLATYPQSPLVHFMKAWIEWTRKDRAAARKEALLVRQLQPTEIVAHYNDRLLSKIAHE